MLLLPPPFRSLDVMQSPVVTDIDLMKAVIVGCPQIGPGLKPCTKIMTIIMGRAIQIRVDGEIPILYSLRAISDGNPPGLVSAVSDGGSNAEPGFPSLQAASQAMALMNASQRGSPFCVP